MYLSASPAAAIIQEDGKQHTLKDTAGTKSKEAGRRAASEGRAHSREQHLHTLKKLGAKAMGGHFEYQLGKGDLGWKKRPRVHLGAFIQLRDVVTQTQSNHSSTIISSGCEQLLRLAIYSARKTAESFSEGAIYLDNNFGDRNCKRSPHEYWLSCWDICSPVVAKHSLAQQQLW